MADSNPSSRPSPSVSAIAGSVPRLISRASSSRSSSASVSMGGKGSSGPAGGSVVASPGITPAWVKRSPASHSPTPQRRPRASIVVPSPRLMATWADDGRPLPAVGSLEKLKSRAPGVRSASSTVISLPCSCSSRYWSQEPSGMSMPGSGGGPLDQLGAVEGIGVVVVGFGLRRPHVGVAGLGAGGVEEGLQGRLRAVVGCRHRRRRRRRSPTPSGSAPGVLGPPP